MSDVTPKTQEHFDQTLRLIYSEFHELWEITQIIAANSLTQDVIDTFNIEFVNQPKPIEHLHQRNKDFYELYDRKLELINYDIAAYEVYCQSQQIPQSKEWQELTIHFSNFSKNLIILYEHLASKSYGKG